MRLRYGASILGLVLATSAILSADPQPQPIPKSDGAVTPVTPTPTPKTPQVAPIKFNEVAPVVPTPMPGPSPQPPAPDPAAVAKLPADQLYVAIQSDTPFLLFASPANLVTITKESGPLKVRGRFTDGTGKFETRLLTAKYIAIVEAAGAGRVELIAVPVGADAESAATRKLLDVDDGTKPIPPPVVPKVDPKVEPAPAPKPKPTPGDPFRVLFVYESSASLSKEQLNILNSTAIRDYLNAKCVKDSDGRPGWRMWDKDIDVSKDLKVWRDIWAAAKPKLGDLPQVVVVVSTDGTTIALPATEAETLTLLKQYGGP